LLLHSDIFCLVPFVCTVGSCGVGRAPGQGQVAQGIMDEALIPSFSCL
jgi:hypothetical protein